MLLSDATGGSFTSFILTFIIAVSLPPAVSETSTVKLSEPLKYSLGVYMKEASDPSRTTVPSEGVL